MQVLQVFNHYSITFTQMNDGDMKDRRIRQVFLDTLSKKYHKTFQTLTLQHGSAVMTARADLHDYTGDAMINTDKNTGIGFIVGDCVPIIITAKNTSLMAIVHGGWRSLLQNILLLTFQDIIHAHDVNATELQIWIGPGLRKDHNTFPDELVQAQFTEWQPFISKVGDTYSTDLIGFIKKQCYDVGIAEANITDSGICTYCEKDTYFSHRRSTIEHTPNGRFYVGVFHH